MPFGYSTTWNRLWKRICIFFLVQLIKRKRYVTLKKKMTKEEIERDVCIKEQTGNVHIERVSSIALHYELSAGVAAVAEGSSYSEASNTSSAVAVVAAAAVVVVVVVVRVEDLGRHSTRLARAEACMALTVEFASAFDCTVVKVDTSSVVVSAVLDELDSKVEVAFAAAGTSDWPFELPLFSLGQLGCGPLPSDDGTDPSLREGSYSTLRAAHVYDRPSRVRDRSADPWRSTCLPARASDRKSVV